MERGKLAFINSVVEESAMIENRIRALAIELDRHELFEIANRERHNREKAKKWADREFDDNVQVRHL